MKKIRNEKKSGVKGVLLKSLVAITLLSAMIVSAFLGTSNAEYFKTLKKKLDMEMTTDLNFAYHLRVNGASTTGVYKNTKNISQKFLKSDLTSDFLKIKVPVDEEGYYTISFNVDFWVGTAKGTLPAVNSNGTNDTTYNNYVSGLGTPVGCQMYSHKLRAGVEGAVDITNFFDSNDNVTVSAAGTDSKYSYFYGSQVPYSSVQLLETKRQSYDGYYQGIYHWQTLTPTRAENVELSFYASGQDVKDGFMVWYWDFTGLKSGFNYELHLRDISIEKHDPREGLPYIEFGETKYVNNVKSATDPGTNYPNRARGTYATTATFDKLVMQLNPLWDTAAANSASTPMSFSVPIKNVKANTSYKVYFDFSIALQDGSAPYKYSSNYGNFFKETTTAINGNNFYFKSYLHNGPVSVDTVAGHETEIKTVTNANKVQEKKEMTDYSDLLDTPTGATFDNDYSAPSLGYTSVAVGDNLRLEATNDPVRDAITINSMTHAQALNYANTSVGCDTHTQELGTAHNYGVNWLNAIRHSEVNSENQIHWLTFYNTNFTFNVSDVKDLNWVWAIDGLVPTNWYRIKIDNVRIEEVVPYGSFQMNGRLNIEGVDCDDFGTALYDTHTRENFVRSTFRYSNGTGQNYRPRGYVDTTVNDNNVLSANNIFGAIYDAGDIYISNEKSAYDDDEPLGDYTIGLRGYTAVKGGVNKYVWSVDGGKTWHDMAYEETLSNHTVGYEGEKVYGESLRAPWLSSVGEPSMITQICESFVDQGFIGLKDYSGKIIREGLTGQTQGDLTYVKDTTEDRGEKKHKYSVGTKDAKGDFVDFLYGVDDINSLYIYMQADLSEYKDHSNLDVVFAAVPNGNPDARCEILRIINYNPMPKYHTRALEIESDISVLSGNNEVLLNATHNAENAQSNIGFPPIYGVLANGANYNNSSTGYAHRIDVFENYEKLKATYYDIPVKTELKVKGFAFVEGGTEQYYWSADYGKTWHPCIDSGSYGDVADYLKYRGSFYDGIDTNTLPAAPAGEPQGEQTHFFEKCRFDDGISADLSDYEGQVVDVIFGAKSYYGGPVCPVARVDNVGVYGEYGTFYTSVHRVILDGRTDETRKVLTTASVVDYLGNYLNFSDKWNMGLNAPSYTVFEPYNVKASNARLYYNSADPYLTDQVYQMQSGGRIAIDGYVVCKGEVARYKFSLDGGETWTVINDTGGNIVDSMLDDARRSDVTFDKTEDGENGNFCCTGTNPVIESANWDTPGYYDNCLEFNLPALPDGAIRNLLVVAETEHGKDIPVLHIKLKFKHANGVSQYGYQSSTNRGELSTLSAGWQSELNQSLIFALSGNSMNRITIPVTQSGEHQLVFTHMLNGGNITNGSKAEFFVVHDDGDYTYFSDVSRQLNSNAENVEHVYSVNCPDNGGLNRITANITVTDDDVKRGYIVLDANYTGITADIITVNLQLARDALTKKPEQTLIDTFFATKDKGYGNNVLMSTATKAGNHSFSYAPILNPPIKKGGINYDGKNKFPNASLSVPKTYFEVGEPITVDYNATGLTNYGRIYITSDQECQPDRYGDLYIKCAEVNAGTTGIVKFTADAHNFDDSVYGNGNVPLWTNNIDGLNELRKLPAGEYKIWFINNTTSFDPFNMQRNPSPYQLVTEPISIKVIDPAEPDLSMTYWTDRPYTGRTDSTTALTLNKVVYEQGEEIPFRISGGYEHSWVTVVRSDDFKGYVCDGINVSDDKFASYEDKSYVYCRYAQWGAANDYLSGNGYLKTIDCGVYLEPGQYKVVYLFGQCLQHAWAANDFPVQQHRGQKQKIMAIIDITIVPKNTLQKYSASYVKNDGSVGNILLDDIEPAKLENLTHTVTTLNDSTFTVKTTPVRHNVTLNIPNDVDTSLKNNVAFNIQTLPGNYSFNKVSDGEKYYNAPFYSANLGSGTAALKIPVTAKGTYDLSFGGYLNSPIAHRGYNKKITTTWHDPYGKEHKIPLNYDGAYMSVPKAVYTVGEVIPISYYSKGSVTAVSPIKETGNLPWIGLIEHTLTQEPADFENEEDMTGNSSNGVWHKRSYVNANTEGVKYISTAGIPAGTYQIYFRDNSAELIHDINENTKNIYWWEYDMVHPITITIVESNNVANANSNVKYAFSNVKNAGAGNQYTSGTAELSQRVLYQGDNIDVYVKLSDTTQIYRLVLCRADDTLDNFVVQKFVDVSKNSEAKGTKNTIKTSNFAYKSGSSEQGGAGNEKIPPGKYTLYFINRGSIIGANSTGCIYAVMDITILPENTPTTVPVRGSAQIQSLSKPNNEIIEITQNLTPPTEIANPFNYYNVSGTFTVTQQDVERGYVIFEYNLTGLPTYSEFTFAIDNLTVTKKQT